MQILLPLMATDFVGIDNVLKIVTTRVYWMVDDDNAVRRVNRGWWQGDTKEDGTPYIKSLWLSSGAEPGKPGHAHTAETIDASANLFPDKAMAETWAEMSKLDRTTLLTFGQGVRLRSTT